MMRMRIWAVRTVQKVNLLEELKRWMMKEKGKGKGKGKKKEGKKKKRNQESGRRMYTALCNKAKGE